MSPAAREMPTAVPVDFLDGLWYWNLGMISDCLLDLGYLTVWVVWTLCVWFDICLLLYVCFVVVSFVVTRIWVGKPHLGLSGCQGLYLGCLIVLFLCF